MKTWCSQQYLHGQSHANNSVCARVSYPAISGFIKYLWGERVPRGRPGLLWDILPHPLPVGLIGRDVALLELNLIDRQEAHHILLLLFNLRACRWERVKEGGSSQLNMSQPYEETQGPQFTILSWVCFRNKDTFFCCEEHVDALLLSYHSATKWTRWYMNAESRWTWARLTILSAWKKLCSEEDSKSRDQVLGIPAGGNVNLLFKIKASENNQQRIAMFICTWWRAYIHVNVHVNTESISLCFSLSGIFMPMWEMLTGISDPPKDILLHGEKHQIKH